MILMSCGDLRQTICQCVLDNQLPKLLKDILCSMPDPVKFNKPYEQAAVKKIMVLEYEED